MPTLYTNSLIHHSRPFSCLFLSTLALLQGNHFTSCLLSILYLTYHMYTIYQIPVSDYCSCWCIPRPPVPVPQRPVIGRPPLFDFYLERRALGLRPRASDTAPPLSACYLVGQTANRSACLHPNWTPFEIMSSPHIPVSLAFLWEEKAEVCAVKQTLNFWSDC